MESTCPGTIFMSSGSTHCFFCLKDLCQEIIKSEGSSSECDVSTNSQPPTLINHEFSLRNFSRFIKLFHDDEKTRSEDSDLLKRKLILFVNNSTVLTCKECSKLTSKFSDLHRLLEKTKMRLNWCIQQMYDAMSKKISSEPRISSQLEPANDEEDLHLISVLRSKAMRRMKRISLLPEKNPALVQDHPHPVKLEEMEMIGSHYNDDDDADPSPTSPPLSPDLDETSSKCTDQDLDIDIKIEEPEPGFIYQHQKIDIDHSSSSEDSTQEAEVTGKKKAVRKRNYSPQKRQSKKMKSASTRNKMSSGDEIETNFTQQAEAQDISSIRDIDVTGKARKRKYKRRRPSKKKFALTPSTISCSSGEDEDILETENSKSSPKVAKTDKPRKRRIAGSSIEHRKFSKLISSIVSDTRKCSLCRAEIKSQQSLSRHIVQYHCEHLFPNHKLDSVSDSEFQKIMAELLFKELVDERTLCLYCERPFQIHVEYSRSLHIPEAKSHYVKAHYKELEERLLKIQSDPNLVNILNECNPFGKMCKCGMYLTSFRKKNQHDRFHCMLTKTKQKPEGSETDDSKAIISNFKFLPSNKEKMACKLCEKTVSRRSVYKHFYNSCPKGKRLPHKKFDRTEFSKYPTSCPYCRFTKTGAKHGEKMLAHLLLLHPEHFFLDMRDTFPIISPNEFQRIIADLLFPNLLENPEQCSLCEKKFKSSSTLKDRRTSTLKRHLLCKHKFELNERLKVILRDPGVKDRLSSGEDGGLSCPCGVYLTKRETKEANQFSRNYHRKFHCKLTVAASSYEGIDEGTL